MSNDDALSAGPAPSFELKGKVALVTGAARGIGRAYAIALAQALINGTTLLVDGGWTAR